MTYGLVGRHLKHSFSKMIHESFKKYKYELIEVEPESIDDFFNHPQFNAVNVTIPYKQIAYKHCDVLDVYFLLKHYNLLITLHNSY